MKMRLRLFACCAVALALGTLVIGCHFATTPTSTTGFGVYVLNEGAYGQGNAELSYYSYGDNTVQQNVFSSANPGMVLGDVANHMVLSAGRLYVVVNNSNKIEIINAFDQTSVATVHLARSPRELAIIAPDKAYVTNMDSTVSVLDIGTRQVTRDIVVGPFPEGIVQTGGKAYVGVSGFGSGRTVAVVDVQADTLLTSIPVPDGPAYLVAGPDGRVYVSCVGASDYQNPANDTNGHLIAIDVSTDTVVDSLEIQGHPGKLVLGSAGMAYLIGPGSFAGGPIWKVDLGALSSVVPDFIPGTYYGVGVDTVAGKIFVGDANGFSGSGMVSIYDDAVRKLGEFESGIGPSWFVPNR